MFSRELNKQMELKSIAGCVHNLDLTFAKCCVAAPSKAVDTQGQTHSFSREQYLFTNTCLVLTHVLVLVQPASGSMHSKLELDMLLVQRCLEPLSCFSNLSATLNHFNVVEFLKQSNV